MREGVARSAAGEWLAARTAPEQRTFLSVAETARLLGMSEMTLYRAIHDGEFPAVRIRGRLIVPARAIEEMIEATLTTGRPVDAADWVRPGSRTTDIGAVQVLPLIGFAAFLAVGAVLLRLGAVGVMAFAVIALATLITLVSRTVRAERRYNAQADAEARHEFYGWPR